MIRAKFRCMKVSREWNNQQTAEFRPVNRGQEQDPENQEFWDATPSGEAQMLYLGEMPFEPGDYYYIDMEADPKGDWTLDRVTRHGDGGEVYLSTQWDQDGSFRHGYLKMWIKYSRVVDLYGMPGEKWAVRFHLAEKSDGVE